MISNFSNARRNRRENHFLLPFEAIYFHLIEITCYLTVDLKGLTEISLKVFVIFRYFMLKLDAYYTENKPNQTIK